LGRQLILLTVRKACLSILCKCVIEGGEGRQEEQDKARRKGKGEKVGEHDSLYISRSLFVFVQIQNHGMNAIIRRVMWPRKGKVK
jgi:hypothetical protein